MANVIVTENLTTGDDGWKVTKTATTQIAVYADNNSYNPSDTVSFHVSTQVAGTTYTLAVYRLGWYGGAGGRLLSTASGRTGVAQGYFDGSEPGTSDHTAAPALTNGSPLVDNTTKLLDCNWSVTDTWAIPANAVTGIYVAMVTDASGFQAGCAWTVRGNTGADYLYQVGFLTSAAYNIFGGWSLYTNPGYGVKVSLNRPDWRGYGYGNVYVFDMQFIKWIERQGYNISYCSDIDVHAGTVNPNAFKAMFSVGHDEYWTKAKRDSVEAAIASGTGVLFSGANASYWQCRLEADSASRANRTMVCYKVITGGAGIAAPANDPQYGVSNAVVTTHWRDAILNRPEATMIGIQYSSYFNHNNVPWVVDASAGSDAFLAGTRLVAGQSYGVDLVGYEYDKQAPGVSPSNLKILGTTSVVDVNSVSDTSHTAYYYAPSGALVFATGSISLHFGLDPFRYVNQGQPWMIPEIQRLYANIMAALVTAKTPSLVAHTSARFSFHS